MSVIFSDIFSLLLFILIKSYNQTQRIVLEAFTYPLKSQFDPDLEEVIIYIFLLNDFLQPPSTIAFS